MSDTAEKLAAIRKKFVGTGEEHDLLAELSRDFQSARQVGYEQAQAEFGDYRKQDDETLKLARALCSATSHWHGLMNFISDEGTDWYIGEAAKFFSALGMTPAMVRRLADCMEEKPVEASHA